MKGSKGSRIQVKGVEIKTLESWNPQTLFSITIRSRYEIPFTFLTISLRLLMPVNAFNCYGCFLNDGVYSWIGLTESFFSLSASIPLQIAIAPGIVVIQGILYFIAARRIS